MSEEQMNDSTFSRLFIIMIIAMTILTVILVVIAQFAANDVNDKLDARSDIENTQSLAKRISPVGAFSADSTEVIESIPAAPVILTGEEAYQSCAACHASGVAGAPVLGDSSVWADRISKGIETLYNNAINGFQGNAGYMPAKGGNTALSDESVKAAVDYMVEAAAQ